MGWTVRGLKPGCGKGIFSKTTQTGMGPQTLLLSGYRAPFQGVKWQRREVNHSPPSSVEVKERVEQCVWFPICLHGVERDTFLNLTYRVMCNRQRISCNMQWRRRGGVEVQLYSISTLNEGGWTTPSLGRIAPVERTQTPLVQVVGWAPGLVWRSV